MGLEMIYELNDETVKEIKKSSKAEREKHKFKACFGDMGILNAYGSIPIVDGEHYHLLDGFDRQYAVSNRGTVISISAGKVLTAGSNENNYQHVGLYKNGKEQTFKVSYLVASAFCPNTLKKPVVHHIDKKTSNNRAENLLWVTKEEHKTLHHLLNSGDDNEVYYMVLHQIQCENEGRA